MSKNTENKCDCVEVSQVRKIGPTRRSVSGVYMFRGKTPIQFESTLERDFVIREEFSLAVQRVVPQPCQIPFLTTKGRTYKYTPDFLVVYGPGSCYSKPKLVEIKPEKEWRAHWREWLPKWKAAWRYASDLGWDFHIHDETRIRDRTYQNIRDLDRYKRMRFGDEKSRAVIEIVLQAGRIPLHQLLTNSSMGENPMENVAHIWHLLAVRQLDCDMSGPLNDSTMLWIPGNE
ncbi:TnsA endonuclease C terminal [Methylomagnum ishizawai]|uniref:TnsA endonuclease C terminal n=1 Tax=Methylomagnum ishizawai TaxID=1760988 RepID=A0A1Y6CXI9_9GAMM|nr:TnsA endonuclease N-terminal domain-containing protein [Methylomagnum ishizawai]SMF94996.1 TnsA endonuclease C terminal [Methylomagnum ishizawai]